ncbi:MAG TPA: hypothetical protein VGM83_21425 [Devosiaceae bacterium]|jgi:hypothetical protein
MVKIDEILLLVGRLNYTWTNTESLLIYLIGHLMGTPKEAAIVVFLTLNTTRARLDLVERLAKMAATPPETRAEILAITNRLKAESRLRNKYNHCIYSFDENGEMGSTQLMRLAEFGDDLKYGKVEDIDQDEVSRIQDCIREVVAANKLIWKFINAKAIAT